ncbi:MAG: S41 family peptidase [Acidobacteria bacterium]|nr:S41 family peptidase [Acidobacteriota bacterium]
MKPGYPAAVLLVVSLSTGCAARGTAGGAAVRDDAATVARADTFTAPGRAAVLDAMTTILAANYVGEGSPAQNPAEHLEARRDALLALTDADAFYAALNETLAATGIGHLYVFRAGRDLFDRDNFEDRMVGATLRQVGDYFFVDDVWEGGPAAQAGLRYGDQLLPVDDRSPMLDPLPPGKGRLRLWVRRSRESPPFFMEITPVASDTAWYLAEATRASLSRVPMGACRIGHVHLRTFANETLVDELIAGTDFDDSDGLIIDLRGNNGGEIRLAGEVFDLLTREPSVWIRYDRRSYPFPATSWNRPLVVLVDNRTRSTAEIFAAAVQARGLGTIVGTTTAGQVQGSQLFPLPDGSRFLVPVSQVLLPDGDSLEGRGVIPDVSSVRPLMFADGDDPPMAHAMQVLAQQLACPEELPPESFPQETLPPEKSLDDAGGSSVPVP